MTFDHLVIGAGTAGCIMADRLSASGASVAVIEAGGDDRHMHVQIPAAFGKLFRSERDWNYDTTPQAGLNGRRIFWPRGKMLGGSSSMNAQIHQWCERSDFDGWAASGATGWGWADLLPSFQRTESRVGRGRPGRGRQGGVTVCDLRDRNPLTDAFLESARADGFTTGEDYNGTGEGAGVWPVQAAHRDGRRCNAAEAFLRPALRRRNLTLLSRAQVTRIVFDGRRACGVMVRQGGGERLISARRGVVLCAGAVNTPQLLMLSGVGPAASIKAAGVTPLIDRAGVGADLQDHLMALTLHRARRPVSLKSAESPANLMRYLLARRGMLSSNVAEAMAFFATEPGGPPDIELIFAPVLYADEGLSPPACHGFSLGAVLLTPKSRGRIDLAGPDPTTPPAIDAGYLSDPGGEDLRRLVAGVRRARSVLARAPISAESAGEIQPGAAARSDAEIAEAIRATAHTLYHPVGTCRMGSDPSAVVDPRLAVRGATGLWIADASVMPAIPRGHPNAVVMAIADRGAAMILADS